MIEGSRVTEQYINQRHELRVDAVDASIENRSWHRAKSSKVRLPSDRLRGAGPGRCGRCEKEVEVRVHDHNHLTGRSRGLVCMSCNVFIGKLEHVLYRPEQALLTLKYLEETDHTHPLICFYRRPGGLAANDALGIDLSDGT